MAAHESARTTKLYDRRNRQVTLGQVERIVCKKQPLPPHDEAFHDCQPVYW
jgi:hypothetical protein